MCSICVVLVHVSNCSWTVSAYSSWHCTLLPGFLIFLCAYYAGKAIEDIPRDQVVIASKWGVMKDEQGNYTQDNSAAYARKSLEGSLKRLGVDYIDLYIMRSWDHKTPIEEAIRGMVVRTKITVLQSSLT